MEEVRSGQFPEVCEGVDDRQRVVAVAQEGEHETTVSEHQGQEDLAPDASDDGVHLDHAGVRCGRSCGSDGLPLRYFSPIRKLSVRY